ncbi:MAG: hypothetical protein ACP5E3_16100, partial [Bacteroidales bacterium]
MSSFVNLILFEGELIKNSGGNNWNAGAASISNLMDNSKLEFIAGETNSRRMIGLSNTDDNANYNTIDFAWYLRNDGNAFIYQNGSNVYSAGSYNASDTFSIAVESGTVHYYINNTLRYTSGNTPTLPLIVDVSLNTSDSRIPVLWVENQNSGSFNAYAINAGPNPAFQWRLNGIDVGTNSTFYSNTGLGEGDIVSCILTPDYNACSNATIASNNVSLHHGIDVDNPVINCPVSISSGTTDSTCTA